MIEFMSDKGILLPNIDIRIAHILEESRVILPGTQVVLAFQLTAVFQPNFTGLLMYLKYIHLVSLCLVSVTIIVLFSIVSYHRIVEKGADSERFYIYANKILLTALALFGIGLCTDVFVIFMFITGSVSFSALVASLLMLLAAWLWYGLALLKRASK